MMPVWMGRLIMVTMGIGFMAATLALTVPSVKRGYFIGKHDKIFPLRAGAGLFLPPDKLMRGQP